MILTDTSVWIDHLRRPDATLATQMRMRQMLIHPFVIGEIAVGSIKDRSTVIAALSSIRQAQIAHDEEVLALIERHRLYGLGLGYIDAHLLASTLLTPATALWSRDRRLREAAEKLGVASSLL